MRFRELMLAAALISPAAMNAQMGVSVAWPVAAGSRVRILSPVIGDQRQVGIAASASRDTLMFRPAAEGASTFAIATPNIAQLELSTGTHTRKAKGAGVGFLIGAVVGGVLGAATYKADQCTEICIFPDSRGFDASLGGVLLGVAGAIVGTVIGASHTDTWVPVAVPHASQTP